MTRCTALHQHHVHPCAGIAHDILCLISMALLRSPSTQTHVSNRITIAAGVRSWMRHRWLHARLHTHTGHLTWFMRSYFKNAVVVHVSR